MKERFSLLMDEDNATFIKEQADELDVNKSIVINSIVKLVREQAGSIGFQIFFTNGYKIKDGRYRNGFKNV